ncbi:MAG: ABC transporter ATP-binding protein [Thermoplasmataceae archaeon]
MEIIVDNLHKTYPNGTRALAGVTFHLNNSGIFSLIGKNGAGKTTLVRILSTQLLPTSGIATINGLDVIEDAREIREIISAVPQEARAIPWMTPLQTITSYLMYRGYTHHESIDRARETLRSLGLENVEKIKNRNLSGGQKRKVLVATALASEASIIYLDEPTTGLDYISRKELWNLLADLKKKRFILLTTHYLEEAERLGDIIGIIEKGVMAGFGTLNELRQLVKYPLSLRIYSGTVSVPDDGSIVEKISDSELLVHTSGPIAYDLVEKLISEKVKFSVQEASLNTIFAFLASGGEEYD